jgi:CHAT domain-containing protein
VFLASCNRDPKNTNSRPSLTASSEQASVGVTTPQDLYGLAQSSRQHGKVREAEAQAEDGYTKFLSSNPEWAGKFKILQIQMMMVRGRNSYGAALRVLNETPPQVFPSCDLLARKSMLQAFALSMIGSSSESERSMRQAEISCAAPQPDLATDLATIRGQTSHSWKDTEKYHRVALALSREHHDSFREAGALNNLAVAKLGQERYDESIQYGESSLAISRSKGYELWAEKAEGTLAFDYYRLGDFDHALELLRDADRRARIIDAGSDRIRWPNNLGLIYEELGQLQQAEGSYNEALTTARQQEDQEQITIALGELAYLSIRRGEWEQAERFTTDALGNAQRIRDEPMELEARLAHALVAAHRGDLRTAEKELSEVAHGKGYESESARWAAQSELADLYAAEHKTAAAKAEYELALKAVGDARCNVQREDLRLSFFANSTRVYGRYIDFLVQQGKTLEALRIADENRALTLAEGLGIEGKKCLASETAFNPQRIAREANATILFYSLGAEHSYLWAIAPDRLKLYQLPPTAQIDAALEDYRKSLIGSRDVLDRGDTSGVELYKTLVAPAEEFFLADSQATAKRAVVIADAALSGLNFETLINPQPRPHYWIEDICVENASSLRLLAASLGKHKQAGGRLLLIGDPIPPKGSDFEVLPNAAKEMQSVRMHFPDTNAQVYGQVSSTPAVYLNGHPEQFAYIHFVAHGVASLSDPLDSAVVLSPSAASSKDEGYKLYAREVMAHPLSAELVTVSTCKGAGVRSYTGEGLVGLSWAFLHAGAHHVIGALWDVSDESTPRLMSAMYAELVKGAPPDEALRTAKLALLHSGAPFHKPYYWAPFQLYTGS